jgi:hypothetical protein
LGPLSLSLSLSLFFFFFGTPGLVILKLGTYQSLLQKKKEKKKEDKKGY